MSKQESRIIYRPNEMGDNRAELSTTLIAMDADSPSSMSSDSDTLTSLSECLVQTPPKQKVDPKSKETLGNKESRVSLDQYLPLGCYTQFQPIDNCAPGEWFEFTEILPEVKDPRIPWKALLDLWRSYWTRIFCFTSTNDHSCTIWRVYLLPEDIARRLVDRGSQRLRKALSQVLETIDVSPETWSGLSPVDGQNNFDMWATGEDCSLFYMFNTLPSPEPHIDAIKDHYSQDSMLDLLRPELHLRGLSTSLYPYQRRSAAMMLQREVAPQMQLDPRLEPRTTPTGETFYYGARDRIFLRHPRLYDSVRGGILAETMGLGKTLICIALILSTKGHWPRVPPLYADNRVPVRSEVGSLLEMAAATVSRQGMPWRKVFDNIKNREGLEMDQCVKAMERQVPTYEIPPRPIRSNRSTTFSSPSEHVRLCTGTIIVVPKNLMHQWQSELSKHVEDSTLKILVMESAKKMLPPASELAQYDVVLFSRTRFENEARKGEEFYESPLKGLHWLRIIIDEGHSFSSTNTNAAVVAERVVRAERRWVVSGTPAKDLLGVEVDLDAMTFEGGYEDTKSFRRKSLEQRKGFNSYHEASSGAIKSLGSLASRFLKAEPWVASEDSARWDEHIYRHEGYQARTFTSFSTCLRRTLENLVIKTQPEDVERDIELPALTHKIVRLEPSFYDKLTANLFVLLFTSNAVTSERTDIDYLFHKGSQMHLHRLIANLRQSAFFWTGFNAESVEATLGVTERYLAKEGTLCTQEDRQLLIGTVEAARNALCSPGWRALTQTQEMGLFVENWPSQSADVWAFEQCRDPMLMGLTQAFQAQKHVNNQLSEHDPAESLASVGVTTKAALEEAENSAPKAAAKAAAESTKMVKQGVPSSSLKKDTTRLTVSGVANSTSPRKSSKNPQPVAENVRENETLSKEKPKRGIKRRFSAGDTSIELAPDSSLGRTSVIGTTSAKFSYLLDRVLTLHTSEKILIFFDANHQAYYLSQAFDLFNIKHLIYANTLTGEQRGKYIVLFNSDPGHRVLLMDIKQAAHGLNLSSASRVFFLNPVCRPGIEAQAIKRAHRIGQTRPVHVETLVLRGTVEEAMHERASRMTRSEHIMASKFLEDDGAITRIIQQARVLRVDTEEMEGKGQMARLAAKQQIFGRPGRGGPKASGLEKELFGDEEVEGQDEGEGGSNRTGKRQRKAAALSSTGKRSDNARTGAGAGAGSGGRSMSKRRRKDPLAPWDTGQELQDGGVAGSQTPESSLGSAAGQAFSQAYSSIFGGGGNVR